MSEEYVFGKIGRSNGIALVTFDKPHSLSYRGREVHSGMLVREETLKPYEHNGSYRFPVSFVEGRIKRSVDLDIGRRKSLENSVVDLLMEGCERDEEDEESNETPKGPRIVTMPGKSPEEHKK